MHPTPKPPVIVLAVDEVALYLGATIWDNITPAHVLRCAAIYIRIHGWHHDSLYREEDDARASDLLTTPPACAYGAIGMAAFGRPLPYLETDRDKENWRLYNRSCVALDDYLTLTFSIGSDPDEDGRVREVYGDIWNDKPDRTDTQVIDALNNAATYYDTTHTPAGGAQ